IGLARPSAGTVELHTRAGCRTPMALVFQDARLLPWRRVVANVAFGLEGSGLSRAQRLAKAREMLALVGLADLGQRWPHQLSGGQRQRVAIARALAVDPDVLLMDEPFSALDSLTREGLQDELQRIQAATGKTILFVTHDIDEAVTLADRVVVLAGSPGRVAADVTIDVARPRRRRDAALTEAARQLRAELSGRSAEL
ncbi:MAG TPA: ATP-binding cassette domain-containing protein, partial [Methylobacterium sp.]